MQIFAIASLLAVATVANTDASPVAAQNETRALQSGSCLAPEWHFDYPDNDILNVPAATHEQCCGICTGRRECGAYTWTNFNGGTCWLKGARSRAVWKGANSDGSANTISAEVNRCGRPVTANTDLQGIEGDGVPGVHPESCCGKCINIRGCRGFAWTDYNGGTCWLKGGNPTPVPKQGAYAWWF
jgi:hypothetical protein